MRIAALSVALFVLVFMAEAIALASNVPASHAGRVCLEDEPCWNWNHDGNGLRGVITRDGRRLVVDCAGMRRLVKRGQLSPRTPRIRGDRECGRR